MRVTATSPPLVVAGPCPGERNTRALRSAARTPTGTHWKQGSLSRSAVRSRGLRSVPPLRSLQGTSRSQQGRSPLLVHASTPAAGNKKTAVLVTGAAGKTGRIAFTKLLAQADDFDCYGLVRNKKSAKALSKRTGAPLSRILVGDTLDPGALDSAMEGIDALIILTSAVPQIKKRSIVKMLAMKLVGKKGRPEFRWKLNENPEQADWRGQKYQIDAAQRAGVKKIVLVGSMGGTQLDNFLNTIGPEGEGNILVWKRKAEIYLTCSGIDYTIIHPGGLTNDEGGQRELVFGVNDTLLETEYRRIPRADVAEVAVQCLTAPEARNKAFDVVSKDVGVGEVTASVGPKLTELKSDYDYTINEPTV